MLHIADLVDVLLQTKVPAEHTWHSCKTPARIAGQPKNCLTTILTYRALTGHAKGSWL